MKNPTGNTSKSFDFRDLLKLPKRIRRWDLLLVDDHGKVMSFQYVKGLVILFVILVLFSFSVSMVLYCLYKDAQEKTAELQNSLETSREDAAVMQQEMRDLMVRLAKAQSKLPKRQQQKAPKVAKKKSPLVKAPPPPVIPKVGTQARTPQATADTKPAPQKTAPMPSLMKIEVGVFDFSATFDGALKAVQVRFTIKNLNRNISEIPGYIFAIMKTDMQDQKGWFPIPAVELTAGRPASIKTGQFFKIRNYKAVELRSKSIIGPKAFNRASVLIYSKKGELLLEKTYRVDIEVAAEVKAEPPSADPVSVPQKQEEALPEEPADASPVPETSGSEPIIPEPAQEEGPGAEPVDAEKE